MIDKETKITYSVVAFLILILGGIAYMLQGDEMPAKTKTATEVAATKKETRSTSTTTEPLTTKPMEDKIFTTATITTNKGVIEITFSNNTPNTVKNFGKLANASFYNGVRFHRVIKDFMIQAGDPLSKDKANESAWGTGGPGYTFADELTGKETYPLGTVAMANSGPNTNGSQFFIVTANPSVGLPPSYTVFGKVTKGLEVAEAIQNVKTGTADRPIEDIIIEKVEAK